MNDGNTYYSVKKGLSRFHIHLKGNYQTYYGEPKKDHVVEFTSNKEPQLVKTLNSVELIANSSLLGLDTDLTFDRVWIYNTRQSTGIKNLRLKSNTFDPDYANDILIDRVQNNWKFNNIRDFASPDLLLSSSAWADISSVYFTDKVPVNLISNPNLFTQNQRLRDRWFNIRLYFKPTTNLKLTTNIVKTQQNISYR